VPQTKALTLWLMRKSQRQSDATPWGDITVTLMDDDTITEVNRSVFEKDRPTDVISLSYDPVPGLEELMSAEIYINVQRALESYARGHWTPSQEFALYLAHGCDHLSGASDNNTDGRTRMRRRELRWLREAKALGMLDGLLGE
jgi:rRNA maturation RNase YbeY